MRVLLVLAAILLAPSLIGPFIGPGIPPPVQSDAGQYVGLFGGAFVLLPLLGVVLVLRTFRKWTRGSHGRMRQDGSPR